MAIYSYVAASKFLKLSAMSSVPDLLPTTYQTSILLRILNAELFTLCSSAYHKLKKVFWMKERDDNHKAQAQIVRLSIVVFSVCLFAWYVYTCTMLLSELLDISLYFYKVELTK